MPVGEVADGPLGPVPLPGAGHGPGHRRQRRHLVVGFGNVPGCLLCAVPLPGGGLCLGHRPQREVRWREVAGRSLGQLHLPGGGVCPSHRLQRPEPARVGDATRGLFGVGGEAPGLLRRVGEHDGGHRDQRLGAAAGVGDAASLLLGTVRVPGPGQGLGQRPGGLGPNQGGGDAGGNSIGLLPVVEVAQGSGDPDERGVLARRVGDAAGVPLDVGEQAGGSIRVDL